MTKSLLVAAALLFAAAVSPASSSPGALTPNTSSVSGTAPVLVVGIELPAR